MKQDKRLNNTGRWMLVLSASVFLLFFLLIAYNFIAIAVTGEKLGHDLNQYALDVYLVKETVQGKRGTIYDRSGQALAEQLTSYTVYANLYEDYGDVVEDFEKTAEQLSEVIDLEPSEIVEILSKEDRKQVEFGRAGRQLTYLEKEKIEEMNLSGIRFTENVKRFYPNGVFASHTIGYTKWDEQNSVLIGEMGIEKYFDEYLAGQNGVIEYLKDKRGYVQPNREEYVIEPVKHGLDISLTIDSTIQTFLEEAMEKVYQESNPESIVAIVANPKTGEILALGSRGSFDPNIRDIENYNNPVISDPFEPGSTMKIYTYAAAINEGKYKGDQYFQSGSRLVNGATIRDYNQTWGTITLNEGFYRSSNTAIIDILTNQITPETNLDYLSAFGFGSTVGLPLSGESAGTMPTDWDITQKMTAGFGQGILTTPMQHIQAITAIINDGEMIKPQIIKQVYDPNVDEIVYETQPIIAGNPITASTAARVRELMVGVVEHETGSGKAYVLDNFTSAGKTGTAQIANGSSGYLSDNYVYSYIGYAPADDPELVMYIATDRPESGGHDMNSSIYKYVMQNSLMYLGAEKTPITDIKDVYSKVEIGNYINREVDDVLQEITDLNLEPVLIGNGTKVYAQNPTKDSLVIEGSKVFVQTSDQFDLPDFNGWTKDDVFKFCSLTGIKVNFEGEGHVVSQSIAPNQTVTKDVTLSVELTPYSDSNQTTSDSEDEVLDSDEELLDESEE
ncbi:MAG TPA: penicillin-binding protein [Firmicutes bacterium]|nr:penicillin-binding protein [Bacillota bacterium]